MKTKRTDCAIEMRLYEAYILQVEFDAFFF